MKTLSANLNCPSCHRQMRPKVLGCEACSLELKAQFEFLEFSQLNSDELHFVRLFIHCEGRIRDLEKALGVSYPTVKAQVAKIKKKLSSSFDRETAVQSNLKATIDSESPQPTKILSKQVIELLKVGKIDYEEALSLLQQEKLYEK